MRKILTAAAAAAVVYISCAAGASAVSMNTGDTLYFDFGYAYADPWITVDSSCRYGEDTGYGFADTEHLVTQDLWDGVLSSAIAAESGYEDSYEFKADISPGLYEITVYSGDIVYMNVDLEGAPAILNVMTSGTEAKVEVSVTDGQLNMKLSKSVEGDTLAVAALTIKKTGEVSDRKTRLFLCGDSTVSTYYPLNIAQPLKDTYRGGWGQMLQVYMPDVYVHNYATQGQSAKTFIERGFLDSLGTFAQAGDYAAVAYGINDAMMYGEDEYRGYMTQIIEKLKSYGMNVIVVSGTPQLDDLTADGGYEYHDLCYAAQAAEIAEENGVDYIDLHDRLGDFFEALGYNNAYEMYWTNWSGKKDVIHLSRNGAGEAARIFSEQLARLHPDAFPNTAYDYGSSTDPRLKCSLDGTTLYLENMTLNTFENLCIVTVYYEDGVISGTSTTQIYLPPLDVLEPNNPAIFTIPEGSDDVHSYIVGDYMRIKIN